MKSTEELNALRKEVETVSRKLAELTDEELAQVSGGIITRAIVGRSTVYPIQDQQGIPDQAIKNGDMLTFGDEEGLGLH